MGNTARIDYIFVERDYFRIYDAGMFPEANLRIYDQIR
jgi:hypothetical protein